MGFFKKKELTEEEKVRRAAEAEERERLRQEKAEKRAAENEERKQERAAKKAEREAADKEDNEFWFGPSPTFDDTMNKGIYSIALDRVRNLLSPNEIVLGTVPAEYDMPGGKEVKGVLVATDQKVVYCSNTITKEFTEVMDYKSMGSISIKNDGLLKREIHVVSGREKRVFDDIKDNPQLKRLLDGVQKQISIAHSGGSSQQQPTTAPEKDRIQQLKELAELKNDGILTEEEFQSEKQRILNG